MQPQDLILYTITVGKITAVQALCYIYRRQNYKHNSNFIPKTFANLIEPKMWPLCMARNGGPSVDVRIHSWPRTEATALGTLLEANQVSEHRPDNYVDNPSTTTGAWLFQSILGTPPKLQLHRASTRRESRV